MYGGLGDYLEAKHGVILSFFLFGLAFFTLMSRAEFPDPFSTMRWWRVVIGWFRDKLPGSLSLSLISA
jgi:hypothetical protein